MLAESSLETETDEGLSGADLSGRHRGTGRGAERCYVEGTAASNGCMIKPVAVVGT